MVLIAPPGMLTTFFALLWFLNPSQCLAFRAASSELAADFIENQMPDDILEMIKLRMPPGTHVSVGFEFECANKEFSLNALLPEYMEQCPAVEFPLDGVSKVKPETMLPQMYGNSIKKELDMNIYDKYMPQAVRNIVWTKDAFITDTSPECEMYEPVELVSKVPSRGLVSHGVVYNNGNCSCSYTLEYKTLPMHTEADIRESMIGAAMTLREASKRNVSESFKNWNAPQLFTMKPKSDKCIGATHVTKAYVINQESLTAMLNQQNFGFCAKGWSKEFAGDKVFRTSFAEAYMLWRSMRYCGDNAACKANLTLPKMCESIWADPGTAQADIEANVFPGEAEKEKFLQNTFHAIDDGESSLEKWASEGGVCTPGHAVHMTCMAIMYYQDQEETFDGLDPELGFGFPQPYFYFGPGGGRRADTTTKVGAMISADGKTLFGLAEHRKDLWNTKDFKRCIYNSLSGKRRDFADYEEAFYKSAFCKNALKKALVVDYAVDA